MKKILNLFLVIILTSSCGLVASHDRMARALQAKIDAEIKVGDPNDVNDLAACPALIKLTGWGGSYSGEKESRDYDWLDGTLISSKWDSLDVSSYKLNEIIKNHKEFHIAYVGSWKFVPKLNKEIRFFAYQVRDSRNINGDFQSKNSETTQIKEKPFSLSKNKEFPTPDRESLCTVKWIAKYGYNAVAEIKSRNPFSKDYLVPTGRILQAKE